MIKFVRNGSLILITLFFLASCVREVDESSESVQRRILSAYMKLNHPGVDSTKSGMYIIPTKVGSGKSIKDSAYAYVKYSSKYISGAYISSCYDSVSRQLGTYSNSKFYGAQVWSVGTSRLNPGLNELLLSMKEGGKSTAVIPPWLLDVKTGKYVNEGEGTITIYDVELIKIVDDIKKYEISLLEEHANNYYNGLDSSKLGFYSKKLVEKEDGDTVAFETDLKVYYIGRFLDGKVFDTNVADTAKKYRIYSSSSSSYSGLSVKVQKDLTEMKSSNSNTISGFLNAVIGMKYGERVVTFFSSDWGYGEKGNNPTTNGIPAYMPLQFEIWFDKE